MLIEGVFAQNTLALMLEKRVLGILRILVRLTLIISLIILDALYVRDNLKIA
jgi:hypothetical protein